LRARIGLTAVLHTWGQNLDHHPHVHCIVPGGGVSIDGERWVECRPNFFLSVRVLSRLFPRLFLQYLDAAFDAGELQFFSDLTVLKAHSAFKQYLGPLRRSEWVVFVKRPFAGPEQALAYLARYTRRVAIANSRVISLSNGRVSLEGLSPRRSGQSDDAPSWRVLPALSDAHPAGRLPSHSSLRPVRKRPPRRRNRALPPTAGGAVSSLEPR
jgi:hypothetical protein